MDFRGLCLVEWVGAELYLGYLGVSDRRDEDPSQIRSFVHLFFFSCACVRCLHRVMKIWVMSPEFIQSVFEAV